MGKLSSKIKKLCQALGSNYGKIYLIDRRQQFSDKLNKPVSILVLNKLLPVAEYNRLHPNKPKDPEKTKNVKVSILSSFKELEVLKYLVKELERIRGDIN